MMKNEKVLPFLELVLKIFPEIFLKSKYECDVKRQDLKYYFSRDSVVDYYSNICCFISDINIHRKYIHMFSLETKKFHLEDYFPLIIINQSLDFIQQYLREFEPDLKSTEFKDNIIKKFQDIEEYYFIQDKISLKIIFDKLEFLLERKHLRLVDLYDKEFFSNTLLNYLNCYYGLDDDDSSSHLFLEDTEAAINLIKRFMIKYDVLNRYFRPGGPVEFDLRCKINLTVYSMSHTCDNFQPFNAKYPHMCQCRVKVNNNNIQLWNSKETDIFDKNYYLLIRKSMRNLELLQFILPVVDLDTFDFQQLRMRDIVQNKPEIRDYFISQLKPSQYQKFIESIELTDIDFEEIEITFLKKIVEDGLDLSNSEQILDIFRDFDEEDSYQGKIILDLLIESGLQNVGSVVEKMLVRRYVSDIIIENYLEYLPQEKIITKVLEGERYYLLNKYIQEGYKITNRDIKKYELDIDYIQFHIPQVIESEGEQVCVICMSNLPNVIYQPCGHMVCCEQCSSMVGNKCAYCKQESDRKVNLPVNSEKQDVSHKCQRCGERDMMYCYDGCNHAVCQKCSFKNKCSVCYKSGKRYQIYKLDY